MKAFILTIYIISLITGIVGLTLLFTTTLFLIAWLIGLLLYVALIGMFTEFLREWEILKITT